MQVLTRKRRESAVVSGFDGAERLLRVTVLRIDPEDVQLGFAIVPLGIDHRKTWTPMQVLTRKRRESVVIGGFDGVERLLKLTVLRVDPENVWLGFEVDPGVVVTRQKTWTPLVSSSLAVR